MGLAALRCACWFLCAGTACARTVTIGGTFPVTFPSGAYLYGQSLALGHHSPGGQFVCGASTSTTTLAAPTSPRLPCRRKHVREP
eukprot:2596574-Prymnesium_polylepis.1